MLNSDLVESAPRAVQGKPPGPPVPAPAKPEKDFTVLRKLLVLYIALWIFEGALRKWILPGLANPLLVARDPVLLLIYAVALAQGVFPLNLLVGCIGLVGAMALGLSFVSTDLPILVQLYGWRADFLHLPLIFLMVSVFDRDDVRRIGKWVLLIAIPMSVLVGLQFLSPPGGFLNRGAGGSTDGMLESAYGHIRPSGTFSFTNGLSGFTSLVAAYFLHHLLERRVFPKWIWLATAAPLLVLITLSGSRAAVGLVGLILLTVVFVCMIKARYWGPTLKLIILSGVAVLALGSFAIFQDGLQVFAYRFGDSDDVEEGFFGRAIDSVVDPYSIVATVPVTGVGLGLGTNAGAALMVGKRTFLVAEGEWPRVLMESGPIVGSIYILLRIAIVIYLGMISFRSLWRTANTLPILIFAGSFAEIMQGQFAQPSGLGFATIAGGLCLAACRLPENVAAAGDVRVATAAAPAPRVTPRIPRRLSPPNHLPGGTSSEPSSPPAPAAPPAGVRRGRSVYAERLHGPAKEDGR